MSVPHAYAFREIEGEIAGAVQRVIADVLGHGKGGFSAVQARAHVEDINRQCVLALQKMSANFKWVVNTLITERGATGGNGMHMENVALWDAHADGCLCAKWTGRNVSCITSVYCLAI
eukprot:g2027.t1